MIFKRVVELARGAVRGVFGQIRPLLRHLIAFRVAMVIIAYPQAVAAQEPAPSQPAPVALATLSQPLAQAIERDLATVFRTQTTAGAYTPSGPPAYPLYATMALDAYRTTRNTAALSQAVYSVARFNAYLFSQFDRDGDRLVESRPPRGDADARVEDPGFNALLAIDAASLARANLELRRTMQALYWYDASRAASRAVVSRTFDPDALYFFPNDALAERPIRQVQAVSALPASFPGLVGTNHRRLIVDRHLLPWAIDAARSTGDGDATARAVERLAAVEVLRADDRDAAVASLRAMPVLAGRPSDIFALYATERAMLDHPLQDRALPLDIFFAIVRASGRFGDADIVRLQSGMADVNSLAFGTTSVPSLDAGDRAVRTVYGLVSELRDKLRASTFWGPDDRRAFPGDASVATERLVTDVLFVTQQAENRLFVMRFGNAGMTVRADLSRNSAVDGEDASMRWQLSTVGQPLEIASAQAGVYGTALAAVGGGAIRLVPGDAPLRFTTPYVSSGGAGMLRPVTFMLAVENAAGVRGRLYVHQTVYINPPVGVLARFPRGRSFDTGNLPIEVSFRRFGRAAATAQYFWFSPSGLRLLEGNQGNIQFAAQDSVSVTFHVEIPSPCRPGTFPFTLKFYANNRDAGTISSSLFKPYQWTVLGPFPAEGGLGRKLPPEIGVGLLQAYAGARGDIAWRPVPARACGPKGEVVLRDLVPEPGTSYLYTVIACTYETDMDVRLSANCPAALFVNGRRTLAVNAVGDSATGVAHLSADKNNVLIKVVGDATSVVSFSLGNDTNLATDEFSNDLLELAGGYRELLLRSRSPGEPQPETHRLVTFRFEDPRAASVAVIGSFNGWSPENHRMQKRDGKVWEITLSLTPGRYAYRFLVDQKQQVLDPSTPITEPDGFGGKNSVVIVSR